MTLKRKAVTPLIGAPKVHWDASIKKAFNYLEYELSECRKSPLYKYVPDVQSADKVYDARLSEKLSHLDVMSDSKGKPIILYHCTDSAFEEFFPLSFFGTKSAAKTVGFERACCHNMYGEKTVGNPEYKQVRQKKLTDETAWLQLRNVQHLRLIPVCLHLKNPLMVTDTRVHTFNDFKNIMLNFFERETYPACLKKDFPVLQRFGIAKLLLDYDCPQVPSAYDMIFKEPLQMSKKDIAKELFLEKLFQMKSVSAEASYNELKRVEWENKNNLSMQRMIRYLEKKGYDGLAFRNWTDDSGSMTYVVFRPEQVVRLDRRLPARLFYDRPSAAHERRLRVLETKSLMRFKDRPLTATEEHILYFMQKDSLQDIPPQTVRKYPELQALVEKINGKEVVVQKAGSRQFLQCMPQNQKGKEYA